MIQVKPTLKCRRNTTQNFGYIEMEPKPLHYARYVVAMVLLYITLTSVGCSRILNVADNGENKSVSSDKSNTSDGEIDTCALITKEDVERILGETVKDPERNGKGNCTYEITEYGSSGRAVNLLATISRDSKEAYEMHRRLTSITDGQLTGTGDDVSPSEAGKGDIGRSADKDQELSGIGDKAYMTGAFRGEFMGSTTTISALKGDVWLSIQIIGTPRKGSKEALTAVAKKVINNF